MTFSFLFFSYKGLFSPSLLQEKEKERKERHRMSLTPEQQQQLAAGVASGQIKIAPKKSKPSGDKPVTMEELNKGTMSNRKFVNLSLLCLILSIFAGTYQFTMGFFPINPHTTEINLPSDVPDAPEAKFNKLVFVVIDALRSDFVSSPNSNVILMLSIYFELN